MHEAGEADWLSYIYLANKLSQKNGWFCFVHESIHGLLLIHGQTTQQIFSEIIE
jgi:hypothetical protein